MNNTQNFDGQLYSYEIFDGSEWEFPEDYWADIESLKDNSPSPRPEVLTIDWIEKEIMKAVSRDEKDDFYKKQKSLDEGLSDVGMIYEGLMLLVFNEKGYLIGKIGLYPNEKTLTLNVMYLYVFNRRSSLPDKKSGLIDYMFETRKYINGPFIVWYFVAVHAQKLFGSCSRVLICYPRDTIIKYLFHSDALFVQLGGDCDYIKSEIKKVSPSVHKEYIKWVSSDYEGDGIGDIGALYCAEKLSEYIKNLEQRTSMLR